MATVELRATAAVTATCCDVDECLCDCGDLIRRVERWGDEAANGEVVEQIGSGGMAEGADVGGDLAADIAETSGVCEVRREGGQHL